jgi:hypothetical protein
MPANRQSIGSNPSGGLSIFRFGEQQHVSLSALSAAEIPDFAVLFFTLRIR